MASNIKGITIEIGGNTGPLDKALKDVNKTSRDLQNELKEVNKQLKLDPTNTVLLQQKQKLLAESVTTTKDKLDTLKEAERQAQQQFKQGKISEEQYRALQREVIKTEQQLKLLGSQADKSNVALSKVSLGAKSVADGAGKVAGKMAPVTIGIVGLGAAATKMGSDFIENTNKVDVAFKDSANSVKEFSKTTLAAFGISSGSALEMTSLFGDMATGMDIPTNKAADMSTSLVGLAGDLSSFKNVSLDVAQNALKGIFTGEGESLKSLGVIMTDTTLKQYAMEQGIKTNYSEMTQAEKVQLRYSYVLDKTKNAQGDFARTSDGAANSMRVASESTKEASASIGVMLAPIIAKAAQLVADMIQKFTGLDDGTKKIILIFLALIAAIAPLAGIIGGIATIVTVVTGAIAVMSAPILIAIGVIVALIAIGILLWKNWDTVKEKAGQLGSFLGTKFNQIKEAIMTPIRAAGDFIGNQVDKIKSFFSGLKIELPKIKLPHFSIKGSFSLSPPSIPTFGVNWYDKGGIFNSPQIIGVGEKRPEFVGALDDLKSIVRDVMGEKTGSGLVVHIDEFVNNRVQDVQAFAEELEFYRKQKDLGTGGA